MITKQNCVKLAIQKIVLISHMFLMTRKQLKCRAGVIIVMKLNICDKQTKAECTNSTHAFVYIMQASSELESPTTVTGRERATFRRRMFSPSNSKFREVCIY